MKIGDKVVCVDDSISRSALKNSLHRSWIKTGLIYVIREVFISNFTLGVRLFGMVGLTNPITHDEQGWRASRFRLLDEMKEKSRNKHTEAQGSEIPMESTFSDEFQPIYNPYSSLKNW